MRRWKCPKGPDHEWPATIADRLARGSAWCPCCAGLRASRTNSLAALCPEVASEWDHAANAERLRSLPGPDEVLATAEVMAWWRCPRGPDHAWLASVADRTRHALAARHASASAANAAPAPPPTTPPTKARKDRAGSGPSLTPNPLSPPTAPAGKENVPRPGAAMAAGAEAAMASAAAACPCCAGRQASVTNCAAAASEAVERLWHRERNEGRSPWAVLATSPAPCVLACHPTAPNAHAVPFASVGLAVERASAVAPGAPFFRCRGCARLAALSAVGVVVDLAVRRIAELERLRARDGGSAVGSGVLKGGLKGGVPVGLLAARGSGWRGNGGGVRAAGDSAVESAASSSMHWVTLLRRRVVRSLGGHGGGEGAQDGGAEGSADEVAGCDFSFASLVEEEEEEEEEDDNDDDEEGDEEDDEDDHEESEADSEAGGDMDSDAARGDTTRSEEAPPAAEAQVSHAPVKSEACAVS